MFPPLATIHDASLTTHRISAVALLVISFAVAILSIIARQQTPLLGRAMTIGRLGSPLVGVVIITGAYLAISGDVEFLQAWLLASIILAVVYVTVLDRFWRRRAREVLARSAMTPTDSEEVPDKAEREKLAGLGMSLVVIVVAATWLMQHQPG